MMMDSTMKQSDVTLIDDTAVNNEQATDDPQIKKLVKELKKDGLITSAEYSVSVKDGRLYINNVKQNNAVNNKYKNIFSGKDDFSYEVKVNK